MQPSDARLDARAATWPLVGRAAELRWALDVLDADRARGVVLVGEAGVGKSRLLDEIARLASRGEVVEQIKGSRARHDEPFGVVRHLLPDPCPSDRFAVLRFVRDELTARGAPLLRIDDAQLLDDATATLVHQIASSGAARVVMALATEPPAPETITAVWKDGYAERLELAPLSRAAVDELLEAVLGPPISGAVRRRLWEHSGGRPRLLRAGLDAALRSGALVRTDGRWSLASGR